MITEEEITQAGEQEKLLTKSYLEGVADFIKWTSTLAIAAILWVGNSITSIKPPFRSISAASLIVLIFSLIGAVVTVRRVLMAWDRQWVLAIELDTFLLLKKLGAIDPSKVSKRKESEQLERLVKATYATRPFSGPAGFNVWVTFHVVCLVLGLALYALAQFS